MVELIVVEKDENQYWELGSAFAEVMIMELNDALKDSGVNDAQLRRKICSQFGFGMGNFIDQYWMEIDGQKYYPLICFSQQFLDINTNLKDIEPLLIPSKDFEYHGAADEVSSEFFQNQDEQLQGIRIGHIGEK